jgi:alkanesulfonate monooxygenase SsuD/methylene tetrahydromethanopterin reductase-like flavin-dependent oxidoreductase (luciferase family)
MRASRSAPARIPRYRRKFGYPEPKSIVTIGVVCADTEEEAKRLAFAGAALFRNELQGGEPVPYSERKLLVGTPHSIKTRLQELSGLYGVDEFMLVTMIPDYRERLRSYERLAQNVWNEK